MQFKEGNITYKFYDYDGDNIKPSCYMIQDGVELKLDDKKTYEKIKEFAATNSFMKLVFENFEPEIMNYLEKTEFTFDDYYYYDNSDEISKKVRTDALKSYPIFGNLFPNKRMLRRALNSQEEFLRAKSSGEIYSGETISTFDALYDFIPKKKNENGEIEPVLPKGTLKKMMGLNYTTRNIENIFHVLGGIGVDWFPKNEEDWTAFEDISEALQNYIQYKDVKREDFAKSKMSPKILLSAYKGSWVEFKQRLAKAYTDRRPPEGTTKEQYDEYVKNLDLKSLEKMSKQEIRDYLKTKNYEHLEDWMFRLFHPETSLSVLLAAANDIQHMAELFSQKVLIPALYNISERSDGYTIGSKEDEALLMSYRILFEDKSLIAIFENTRHFISQAEKIISIGVDIEKMEKVAYPHNLPKEEYEEEWPAVFSPLLSPNGVWLIPLTSSPELTNEGKELRHCVGGYNNKCLQGNCHIIGFRHAGKDKDKFERLSTLEISPIKNNSFRVLQHHGERNGKIPLESEIAFEWFREEMKNNRVAINEEGLSSFYRRFKKMDDVKQMCLYDWKKIDTINNNFLAWEKYIGKNYRSNNIQELFEKNISGKTLNDLADEINPRLKRTI